VEDSEGEWRLRGGGSDRGRKWHPATRDAQYPQAALARVRFMQGSPFHPRTCGSSRQSAPRKCGSSARSWPGVARASRRRWRQQARANEASLRKLTCMSARTFSHMGSSDAALSTAIMPSAVNSPNAASTAPDRTNTLHHGAFLIPRPMHPCSPQPDTILAAAPIQTPIALHRFVRGRSARPRQRGAVAADQCKRMPHAACRMPHESESCDASEYFQVETKPIGARRASEGIDWAVNGGRWNVDGGRWTDRGTGRL
jgi:hypothetical protein